MLWMCSLLLLLRLLLWLNLRQLNEKLFLEMLLKEMWMQKTFSRSYLYSSGVFVNILHRKSRVQTKTLIEPVAITCVEMCDSDEHAHEKNFLFRSFPWSRNKRKKNPIFQKINKNFFASTAWKNTFANFNAPCATPSSLLPAFFLCLML